MSRFTYELYKRKEMVESTLKKYTKCDFCHSCEDDPFEQVVVTKKYACHYFCLLFSQAPQNGGCTTGIRGFKIQDIAAELKRCKYIICDFCSLPNAPCVCLGDESSCNKKFHFSCGIKNGIVPYYRSSKYKYKTFCSDHFPRQDYKIIEERQNGCSVFKTGRVRCNICKEVVPAFIQGFSIWSSCCNNWAHKTCIQKQALNAGIHHFRCATCNNTATYIEEMNNAGIYIPDRDATWEMDIDAFSELYDRHDLDQCDAIECLEVPQLSTERYRQSKVILCYYCGSSGMHAKCANLEDKTSKYVCNTCNNIGEDGQAKEANV